MIWSEMHVAPHADTMAVYCKDRKQSLLNGLKTTAIVNLAFMLCTCYLRCKDIF